MLATTLMLLVVLLALSVPVAAVMGVLGLALNQFFASMPLHRAMGEIVWNASSEYILIAIPLFVMLGEILLRSGIAERVYNGIAQWLSWLPGGLMHANIGACAMFAATSGSSVATAATIGTVAIPEIKKHNYDEPLFLGTIAAGGTLGHSHSAVDQLHPVRAADQHLGAEAVSGRVHSGLPARLLLHGDRADRSACSIAKRAARRSRRAGASGSRCFRR